MPARMLKSGLVMVNRGAHALHKSSGKLDLVVLCLVFSRVESAVLDNGLMPRDF